MKIIVSVHGVNTGRKMQKVVRLDSINRAQIYSASEKCTSNIEAEKIKKKKYCVKYYQRNLAWLY